MKKLAIILALLAAPIVAQAAGVDDIKEITTPNRAGGLIHVLMEKNSHCAGGLYVWTADDAGQTMTGCWTPITAHYAIENFAPKGVEVCHTREALVVNAKGHTIPTD